LGRTNLFGVYNHLSILTASQRYAAFLVDGTYMFHLRVHAAKNSPEFYANSKLGMRTKTKQESSKQVKIQYQNTHKPHYLLVKKQPVTLNFPCN
jgi:hypothetical protein